MPVSQLPQKEIARRIRAARELRAISQEELAKLMAADGLNKYDLGQIERCKQTMLRVHQDALVRHLQVPEVWFTSEDVNEIVGYVPREALADELASIRSGLEELLDSRRQAQKQLRNFDAESARDLLNLIQEVQARQGKQVSKRELQFRRATGHRAVGG